MKELIQNKRLLTFFGGGIVFILLYLAVFVFPTLNRIAILKKEEIPKKEQEIEEMMALSVEYLSMKTEAQKSLSAEGESIFSLVERIAKARGLSENISSMKPAFSSVTEGDTQEVSVEVKMKDMTLQRLVSYLYTLEGPPYSLRIKEIQIRTTKDRLSLEVDFIASRWEKKE